MGNTFTNPRSGDPYLLEIVAQARDGNVEGALGALQDLVERGFRPREALASPSGTGAPTPAIGLAYRAQEIASVPTEPTDVPLDAIATERELILP